MPVEQRRIGEADDERGQELLAPIERLGEGIALGWQLAHPGRPTGR